MLGHELDRLGAVTRDADEVDLLAARQQLGEPRPDDCVVVSDDDPDHDGITTITDVPTPGWESTLSWPPALLTRSATSVKPR
jgi:hypothetical protein